MELEADDVAGDAEEEFETGMRQNEIDRQLADTDNSGTLDFAEFCSWVHSRELGEHTDEELRARFESLDVDGNGYIDKSEYLRFILKDALARSSSRVMDLFRKWDEDGSGEIGRAEFVKAIRAFGIDYPAEDIGRVFDDFDVDGSGQVSYRELNKMLRQGAQLSAELQPGAAGEIELKATTRHKLRRAEAGGPGKRGAALGSQIRIDVGEGAALSGDDVQSQLRDVLVKNAVRVVDPGKQRQRRVLLDALAEGIADVEVASEGAVVPAEPRRRPTLEGQRGALNGKLQRGRGRVHRGGDRVGRGREDSAAKASAASRGARRPRADRAAGRQEAPPRAAGGGAAGGARRVHR